MVSAEIPSENSARPKFMTSRRVGDKIATSYTQCVTEGLSTGKTSYFCPIMMFNSRLRPFFFFFGLQYTARLKLSGI